MFPTDSPGYPAMSAQSPSASVLTGINAEYIAHLYSQYLVNPQSVAESWRAFFGELEDNEAALLRELNGASWTPKQNRKGQNSFAHVNVTDAAPAPAVNQNKGQAAPADEGAARRAALDSIQAIMLIRAYRARGHLIANLDPLGMKEKNQHPELDPAHYGFGAGDYDRPIFINGVLGQESATLRDILAILNETYCGNIGVEFLHMSDPGEKAWIQQRIEGPHL